MRALITFIFLFAGSVCAQSYNGDTWKQASKNGTGNISVAYVHTPSFVYVDNAGKLTGICVDIINDFIEWTKENKKINLQPKFVGDGSNFRGMYNKVKASKGGVFGIGNITITEERKKEVKFTTPFITNFAILISQNSVPTLKNWEDMPKVFNGLTAYTAKGTLNEKRMEELKQKYFPDMTIAYTTTSHETLQNIFDDPKGFAYLDLAFYLEGIKLKKNIKRHAIADKAAEQFGIIMPMNSDWDAIFEEFLQHNGGYLNSSKYKSILVKHLGEAGMKLMQSVGKS